MKLFGVYGVDSRDAISPVCGLDSENLSGKRKPALSAVFDGTTHLGGLLNGEIIMSKFAELHKSSDVVPCVRYPDGRFFYSSRDLAGYFNVKHVDLIATLRKWREYLPASLRGLIDFESRDTALVSEEVFCG